MNTLIGIGPMVLVVTMVYSVALPMRANRNRRGIATFCAGDAAGNLCGLGGVFGLGPLLAGIAIALFTRYCVGAVRPPP